MILTQRRRDAEVVGRGFALRTDLKMKNVQVFIAGGQPPGPPIRHALPRSGLKNTLRTLRLSVSALKTK